MSSFRLQEKIASVGHEQMWYKQTSKQQNQDESGR